MKTKDSGKERGSERGDKEKYVRLNMSKAQ